MEDKGKKDYAYLAILVMLTALAVGILGYDIWYVMSGQLEIDRGGTRHLPFLLPILLVVFIVIMVKVQRHMRGR